MKKFIGFSLLLFIIASTSNAKTETYDPNVLGKINDKIANMKLLNQAINVMRALDDLLLTGWGVGFTIQGNAGPIGMAYGIELVRIERDTLAAYCYPAWTGNTDIGASLGVGIFKTTGCFANEDYTGNFLTFGVYASAGLGPVQLGNGVAYSFGANFDYPLGLLEERAMVGAFRPEDIPMEVRIVWSSLLNRVLGTDEEVGLIRRFLCYGYFLGQKMSTGKYESSNFEQICRKMIQEQEKKQSIAKEENLTIEQMIDRINESEKKGKEELKRMRVVMKNLSIFEEFRHLAPNLYMIWDAFWMFNDSGTYSGCNSIGYGLKAWPMVTTKSGFANIGAGYTVSHYALIGEYKIKKMFDSLNKLEWAIGGGSKIDSRNQYFVNADTYSNPLELLAEIDRTSGNIWNEYFGGCRDSLPWIFKDPYRAIKLAIPGNEKDMFNATEDEIFGVD